MPFEIKGESGQRFIREASKTRVYRMDRIKKHTPRVKIFLFPIFIFLICQGLYKKMNDEQRFLNDLK
jgi:hypothetical protein